MCKDLTNSAVDRKNILNNNTAIQEVYEQVGFYGLKFEGKYRFTKQQIATYFEVDIRTIDRIIENHKQELENSGYELFTGARLKTFKEQLLNYLTQAKSGNDDHDTNVVIIDQIAENEINSLTKTARISGTGEVINLGSNFYKDLY